MKRAVYYQQTGIGMVGIAECGGFITKLCFESESVPMEAEPSEPDVVKEAFRQLNAYINGELRVFSLPLAPSGTLFMEQVWNTLAAIPYGTTATYRDVAAASGNPKAVRAVGMACNRNPLPIFIPCHRVIGSNGTLTGYRGGLALKMALLELEGKHKI
ncbi:MAG: methylated-DNA--[protein]-cysteine S-methyltransferase [Chlorobium sp.]|nr:MAG: methylated-DNA--[protein]-cysteine S-methyltransferase [Chlorobium sp.]